MTRDLLIRAISLCLALAAAETLHGIARTLYLAPRLGKVRAQKLSIVSGSILATSLCYLWVPAMALKSDSALLTLGTCLAVFMASFDIALGKWVLKRTWAKALQDLNPQSGNYLIFGLVWLCFCPLPITRLFP